MQVDELLKPFPIKEFHPFPAGHARSRRARDDRPGGAQDRLPEDPGHDDGLRGSDTVHKIVESMRYHGIEVVVYDKVESNPKDYNVMDAVTTVPGEQLRLVRIHRRRLVPRRLQGRADLGGA